MARRCGDSGRVFVQFNSYPPIVIEFPQVHALRADGFIVEQERSGLSAALAALFGWTIVVSTASHIWHVTDAVLPVKTVQGATLKQSEIQDAEFVQSGVYFVSRKVVCWIEETPRGPVLVSQTEPGRYYAAAITYTSWEDYWKANGINACP